MSMILSLTLCELKREDRTHRNVEEMEENSTSEKQTLGTEAKWRPANSDKHRFSELSL